MNKMIPLFSILLLSAVSHAQCPASQESILATSVFSECNVKELKTARSTMLGVVYDNQQAVSSNDSDSRKALSMAQIATAKATISLINQEMMRKEAANR